MSEYSENEMRMALARMKEKVEAEAYARGRADGQKLESEIYTRALQLVQLGAAINGTVRNIPIVPVPPVVAPEPAPYHQINRAEAEVKAEPEGEGIPLFHGTAKKFDVFRKHKPSELGFHFGTREQAETVAANEGRKTGHLIHATVDIKNPYRMKDHDWIHPAIMAKHARGLGLHDLADTLDAHAKKYPPDEYDDFGFGGEATSPPAEHGRMVQAFKRGLISKGHDGVVYKNEFEGEGDSYIAFHPNQVTIRSHTPLKFDKVGRVIRDEPEVKSVTVRAVPADSAHRTHSVMGLHHAIEEAHANGDHHYAHQLRAVQADALEEAGAHREAVLQRVIAHLHGGPDTPGSLPPEALAATFKNRANLQRTARRRSEYAHDQSTRFIEHVNITNMPGMSHRLQWGTEHPASDTLDDLYEHSAGSNHAAGIFGRDPEYHQAAVQHDRTHHAAVEFSEIARREAAANGGLNPEPHDLPAVREAEFRRHGWNHLAEIADGVAEQHRIAHAYHAALAATEGDQGRGAKSLPDEPPGGSVNEEVESVEVKAKSKSPADPAKALELSEVARVQSERAHEDFPTGHEFGGEDVHHHDAHEFAKIGDWESAAESHRMAEVTHLKHHLAAGTRPERQTIGMFPAGLGGAFTTVQVPTDEAREHLKAADLHRDAHEAITGKDTKYALPQWAKQYHQTLTNHGFKLDKEYDQEEHYVRTPEERITGRSLPRSAIDILYRRTKSGGEIHSVLIINPKYREQFASAGKFPYVVEHTPDGVRKDKWNFDTHDQLAAHLAEKFPKETKSFADSGSSDPAPYGYCPECKEPFTHSNRSMNENSRRYCGNGHEAHPDKAKYSFTGVNLPSDVTDQIHAVQRFIPDEDLGPDGKEKEAHVTVRYGLHTSDAGDVEKLAAGTGAIHLELDGLGYFSGPKQDVVYAKVTGRGLYDLNSKLGELPHTDTHPSYTPHATIAYVKPGLGSIYAAGLPSVKGSAVVDKLVFSDPKKNKATIDLGSKG